MRPWLLFVLLVEVMTYANTQSNMDFDETISIFGDIKSNFSEAIWTSNDVDYTLIGEVVSVIDGNTFNLVSGPVTYHVQLVGIDAPELGQTFGGHAKRYLSDLVRSHTVRVEVYSKDRSGIISGELFVNQVSINKLMLKDGHAWASRDFKASREWQGLEQLARDQSFGLWRYEDVIHHGSTSSYKLNSDKD